MRKVFRGRERSERPLYRSTKEEWRVYGAEIAARPPSAGSQGELVILYW